MMTGATRRQWHRAGHSLPELIVALVLLSLCLGVVTSSAVLGARWTAQAVLKQEAVRRAGEVLDSVSGAAIVASGEDRQGRLVLRWTVGAGEDTASVLVTAARADSGRPLVELRGLWLRPPPVAAPEAGE